MAKNCFRALCVILVLSMAFSMAACGTAASEGQTSSPPEPGSGASSPAAEEDKPITLRVYANYSDEDTKTPWDYAVAAMKEDMPNVTLELDVLAEDDNAKLKTYAATGNMPDIFQSTLDVINTFKATNNILMLDDYAEKLGFKDRMLPSAMNTLIAPDGHIWVFPYSGNNMYLLFYNKEIFSANNIQVPTTTDELLAVTKILTDKDIVPLSLFAKEKSICVALFDLFATRLAPNGIRDLDEGKATGTEDAYRFAAQSIIDLAKAGFIAKGSTNMGYDQAASLFYQGKAAMFLNGDWEIAASTKNLGDKADWMYYPAKDAAGYESSKLYFSGGGAPNGYSVSATTKDKDMAAKVAAYLSLKYAECKYTTRGTPIVATKVDAPMVVPFPPMMEKLAEDIPNIKGFGSFSWNLSNPKFKTPFEDACQSLVIGGYTADEFIDELAKIVAAAQK